jgi:hypothetical protein
MVTGEVGGEMMEVKDEWAMELMESTLMKTST